MCYCAASSKKQEAYCEAEINVYTETCKQQQWHHDQLIVAPGGCTRELKTLLGVSKTENATVEIK